jgi:hypothetical protein
MWEKPIASYERSKDSHLVDTRLSPLRCLVSPVLTHTETARENALKPVRQLHTETPRDQKI